MDHQDWWRWYRAALDHGLRAGSALNRSFRAGAAARAEGQTLKHNPYDHPAGGYRKRWTEGWEYEDIYLAEEITDA